MLGLFQEWPLVAQHFKTPIAVDPITSFTFKRVLSERTRAHLYLERHAVVELCRLDFMLIGGITTFNGAGLNQSIDQRQATVRLVCASYEEEKHKIFIFVMCIL